MESLRQFSSYTYPIIGMSPGNSYFGDEEVSYLLKVVVERFGKVGILIPDIPAIATYVALGYSEKRAKSDKAIPKGNALRNRVTRAMENFGYTINQVRVLNWGKEIESNSYYQEKFTNIKNLYENNADFREAIRSATQEVLEASGKEILDMEDAVSIATQYILSEFACMEFLPDYLQAEKVTYIYHKRWPVFEDYLAGKFDQIPKSYMEFLQIKKETE